MANAHTQEQGKGRLPTPRILGSISFQVLRSCCSCTKEFNFQQANAFLNNIHIYVVVLMRMFLTDIVRKSGFGKSTQYKSRGRDRPRIGLIRDMVRKLDLVGFIVNCRRAWWSLIRHAAIEKVYIHFVNFFSILKTEFINAIAQ